MDTSNRVGLYGSYFFGMAAIGFTLPFLPLYLGQRGMSDIEIGFVSTLAALVSLLQFPVGVLSDRSRTQKPFLIVALVILLVVTILLNVVDNLFWLGVLVIFFAENGICRSVIESLSGAAVTALCPPDKVATELGWLRLWRPTGIVLVALVGGWWAESHGIESIIPALVAFQTVAFFLSFLIRGKRHSVDLNSSEPDEQSSPSPTKAHRFFDPTLMAFVALMILFHVCNAPGGVYLGLFMHREIQASESHLSYAFVASMIAWMLVVVPIGKLADHWGRRPLLIAGWGVMAARLGLLSIAHRPTEIIAIQVLDGISGGIFAVMAATWVTDWLGDHRKAGESQVIVGTSLVLGSAIGPAISGVLVGMVGYRGLFVLLAGVGTLATLLLALLIPETLKRKDLRDNLDANLPTGDTQER